MITVEVKLMWEKEKQKIELNAGSTLSTLVKRLQLEGSENNYLYIINGSNRMKEYILQNNDNVKVFPALSGG